MLVAVAMGDGDGGGDLRRLFVVVGDVGDRLRAAAGGLLRCGKALWGMYNVSCPSVSRSVD